MQSLILLLGAPSVDRYFFVLHQPDLFFQSFNPSAFPTTDYGYIQFAGNESTHLVRLTLEAVR